MANKKISELTPKGSALSATDLLEVSVDAGGGTYTTASITGQQIKDFAGGSGAPKLIVLDVTATSIPSVSTETLIKSVLIPANTLKTNSILDLSLRAGQAVSASCTVKVYLNTSNSLSGALLLGTSQNSSAGIVTFVRTFIVNNTTLTGLNSTIATNGDFAFSTQSTTTINRANNYYLIVSITNSSPQTAVYYGLKLTENA